MNLKTAMILGRVSNLPTVWSNVLAASCLATATNWQFADLFSNNSSFIGTTILMAVGISLLYIGGMYLNDAFDADWDAQHQAQRPIPSGEASRSIVFIFGFALLGWGAAMMIMLALSKTPSSSTSVICTLFLVAAILLYNWSHKKHSFSSWIMGACRFFVYFSVGLALADTNLFLTMGAMALMLYIVGLTYSARLEHLNELGASWPLVLLFFPAIGALIEVLHFGFSFSSIAFIIAYLIWVASRARFIIPSAKRNIPFAIGGLVAGVALLDAMLIAATGNHGLALIALFFYLLTLVFQKVIPGT